MSLTQDDLQAIQGIVQTTVRSTVQSVVQATVQPMIDEAVDSLAQGVAAGFSEVHEILHDHTIQLKDIRADLTRIENKLSATIDQVDDHETRLTRLEHKPA